ncbi:Protein-disulfide isomerase [Actinoalloteichus cyanogriseus DSM 43889]|uniref:Protein-disulfide isomerase n=1 Tax=Actinoalloteichus caeruleus DSM 43889 TaxID=1120930 RepID=A0ABT1JKD4_ACTCY|nr:Protein-disulfide isomerase [Actinoalloteichus caeruleus DSM 43889]
MDVGGAERNARKKRQANQGAKAVSAARASNRNAKPVVVGVVVVLVVAAVIIGGVLFTRNQDQQQAEQSIPAGSASVDFAAQRDGAVVVAGEDTAPVTIDLYEDFLCPGCGAFEEAYAERIESEIAQGNLQVRYHMLPFLDAASDPAGYSGDAANATLCAADAGQFPDYHASLFAAQPTEGRRGYDADQFVELGRDLGIEGDEFATCVREGEHRAEVDAEMEDIPNRGYLLQDGSFGTPTVAVGERMIDWGQPDWLDQVLASGR